MVDVRTKAARLHIDEIRSRKFSIGKKESNPLTKDLHYAVMSLSAELYTRDVHFLMELIQNAEDNEYPTGVDPTIEFVLTNKDITGLGAPTTLLIFNNEIGFSKQNMESICSVGLSTKKGERKLGFIGEKGIGFKSVFLVSSAPHIFSNGYHVKFSENPDKDCGIGFIVPEWVGAKPSMSDIQDLYRSKGPLPTTVIVLPLKPGKVAAVKAQLSELHPELLLFLIKIKRLYVNDTELGHGASHNVSIVSCTETDRVEVKDKRADSRVVQLSVKAMTSDEVETCKYYLWKQAFPVKLESRVDTRRDVNEWIITLAFPLAKRLTVGTSCIGVFAFLPTAMVTNFPFAIQADFLLASSRETILLDNKWNLGILDCAPSAFMDAFFHFLKKASSPFSLPMAFELLPVQASSYHELDKVREIIRASLQASEIVPCATFIDEISFCKPAHAIRTLPSFRELLDRVKIQGVTLDGLCSLEKKMLHPSLDSDDYDAILSFLGVASVQDSGYWHGECIEACNLALLESEDAYIDLLCFIADNDWWSLYEIPVLKYTNSRGTVELCTLDSEIGEACKVGFALEPELHDWLNKCNMELGCPDSLFFLPNSTQRALVCHTRLTFLHEWLTNDVGLRLKSFSALDYGYALSRFVVSKKDVALAFTLAQYIYHSHRKNFINDSEASNFCHSIPVVDGSYKLRALRDATLVPASGSKWASLFRDKNPFIMQHYIDLGDIYGKSGQFAGELTPEKELLIFLSKHCGAVDLDGLCPPYAVLEVASSRLSCKRVFLLLDWIRASQARGDCIPEIFVRSVKNGKWLKTYSGFSSPSKSILPDATGKVIFDMMKNFMGESAIVDQEFYVNKISLYADVLKFLGVVFGLDDIHKLVRDRCKVCASSPMSKNCALSMLMFLAYLKASDTVDGSLLKALTEGKWLKTSQGYCAPSDTVLLQGGIVAEAVSSISKVPIVDEDFYGCKMASFSTELELLGVVSNMKQVYKLVVEKMVSPLTLTSVDRNSGLLVLKCIRHSGSASSALVEKVRNHSWLKTHMGERCPAQSILLDPGWSHLLNGFKIPNIDENFYGDEIRSFMAELKAIGVAVEFDHAVKIITEQLKSLVSSSLPAPDNVMMLLEGIRLVNKILPMYSSVLHEYLSKKSWLKTRHGCKTPSESILFNLKWGTVSLFVDLPLVDDSYYGIQMYGYKDELKLIGVITNFEEGAAFVAKGLIQQIEPSVVTPEGTISLLECISPLMSNSADGCVTSGFLENLRSSTWLKTNTGYKKPEECLLFDPSWDGILCQADVPTFIDHMFYPPNISSYKNQLRIIGVKVDFADVCAILFHLLLTFADTDIITRIYKFFSKFNWEPESVDRRDFQVWIPDGGKWVNSERCVLRDVNNLFDSQLFSLNKYYSEELLCFFAFNFGVAVFPSITDYLQLWSSWVLRPNHQVTLQECCTFWAYIVDNWNSNAEDILKQTLTHLPVTLSGSEEICLVSKKDLFIPDDLLMESLFSGTSRTPLFVWFPKCRTSPFVSSRRLCDIYQMLGVRKVSESVDCVINLSSVDCARKADLRSGLIGKGLIKIVLCSLAACESVGPEEKRHQAAKSLLELQVYETENPIHVSYRLKQSESVLAVERVQMLFWEKTTRKLFINKAGYEDRKKDAEFVICFAQEIAGGLLGKERGDLVNALSYVIQVALMFDFREDVVDLLLAKGSLKLLKEDEAFLAAEFSSTEDSDVRVYRKRMRALAEPSGPSTPVASCKKPCK